MTPIEIFIVAFLSGLGAWVNAVAGGGTFLVFPVLIFFGLGALEANILSTVALWPGVVASAIAYRGQLAANIPAKTSFLLVSLLGSALGTALLLSLPEAYFEQCVPWLLLFAASLLTIGPALKGWFQGQRSTTPLGLGAKQINFMLLCQFFIAVYGGYFGAGIGILMLAVLQFVPFKDIHQTNAMKVMLGLTINAVAFFVFAFSGKVVWSLAIWMLAGGIIGGYVGTRIALKINPVLMRRIILVIAWAVTMAYFLKH